MTGIAPEQRIAILTPTGRDGVATAELLTRAQFTTHVCKDLGELMATIETGAGAVLVAEEALMATDHQPFSDWIARQPAWSDLPVIILSTRHDNPKIRAWRETVTPLFHNVSFLERPVQGITLISALSVALRARRRQYEVRTHLSIQADAAHELERLVRERTKALESANRELNRQIAERHRVEEQLRHAQKMEAIGQLTGGLAHDFNNMLAIIMGGLNMLGRRLTDAEPSTRKYVDTALEGARRAAQLTQRLLAFSRQQALSPVAVDVNKLVGGMSELLGGALGREIILSVVSQPDLWQVHVDPNQLENAILNIAINARDAMPDGGRLIIEARNVRLDGKYSAANLGTPPGQYLMISITDTGNGMSAETAEKAFDPFFTTKDVGKGTGLGLSQVYGFVKQSGGHIKIYSAVGKGTSLKIYLPRYFPVTEAKTIEVEAEKPSMTGHQELVLVVDDELAVRALAADALRELGYRVLESSDAPRALALLDEYPTVDLLFTDVVMPEINGRKLADEALRKRPGLKVLFTTGYTRDAVVHNGVLEPGVNLLGKPYALEELAEKVRDVLNRP